MAVTKEILSLAVETGDALLRNGAEVYRVEFLRVQMKIKMTRAA